MTNRTHEQQAASGDLLEREKTMEQTVMEVEKAPEAQPPAPVEQNAVNLIQVIERAALNPEIDVEKMERLLAMQERIVAKEAEGEFSMAMAAAQAEMGPVRADADNSQTRSKYASYAALDRALRPIYTKHGFSLSFDSSDGAPPDHVRILCYVGHRGGFTRTYRADMPADGKGAKGGDVMTKTHAMGAAFTYGQRYLLKAIFNIAVGEDDDGNSASAGGEKISAEQKQDLIDLMQAVEADTEKFLRYLRIPYIDDLPANRFEQAKAALEKKRGKQ